VRAICLVSALWLFTASVGAAPTPLIAGGEFQSAETRALQADDFANPAMLWVAQGAALWRQPAGPTGKSCADCHQDAAQSMKGVATRYPRFQPAAGRVLNLAGQINFCVAERQRAAVLAAESAAQLALSAYVSRQSRGMPMAVTVDAAARETLQMGERLYRQRIGQFNLACTHCHDARWGKRLLHDTVSQGHGADYPVYRFEWQTLGSLQRRLRACFSGVRAEMPPYDAAELEALELYLAVRANGLPLAAPGVRK
jgi:L-cysteine S-thiosulfotransferase